MFRAVGTASCQASSQAIKQAQAASIYPGVPIPWNNSNWLASASSPGIACIPSKPRNRLATAVISSAITINRTILRTPPITSAAPQRPARIKIPPKLLTRLRKGKMAAPVKIQQTRAQAISQPNGAAIIFTFLRRPAKKDKSTSQNKNKQLNGSNKWIQSVRINWGKQEFRSAHAKYKNNRNQKLHQSDAGRVCNRMAAPCIMPRDHGRGRVRSYRVRSGRSHLFSRWKAVLALPFR